ncbi:dehydrodolichyl diphosphate synthase complex subunit nus1-like [Megalops cyprinoides]|uniref:dehydrodolichyl diphosphate synthase complex subunit nus1-like n=1 Tax=Megalops cyprinoides TaxID=118141 RepID=UPI001865195A|nr:dehydrodolichyl diphosphate synthase complex subunit nus1-like [Megalops cyprinoides]
MALVYGFAWRVLHVLLHLQRALLTWLRTRLCGLNRRVWKRLMAALLFPVTFGLQNHVHKTIRLGPPPSKRGCRRVPWGPDPRSLEKLPLHVGLLIADEEPRYTDVANLVVWCMAVGISYVSVYDQQGVFRRNSARLTDVILKQQDKLLGLDSSDYAVEFLNNSSEKHNPHALAYQVSVRVLSADDGRPGIVQAAQQLCRAVERRERRAVDIDVGMLDSTLGDLQKHIPDPDLVLKFGQVNSTLGFLPWHIRLTEFISLPSLLEVSYEDFYCALQRYATCEQREGK